MKFSFPFLALTTTLATTIAVVGATEEVEVDLSMLGSNDLSVYNYETETTVDENCDYTLTMKFSHDDEFPFGGPDTCLPGVDAPEDGLPYLMGRWKWERLPKYVRDATGLDHPSIDWNPCGHPGEGFLTPHYDVHFYTVSPTFRATRMVCDVIPGLPVCDPGLQESAQGRGFFNVARTADSSLQLANMPQGFEYALEDAIIHMGLHAWNVAEQPNTPEEWIHPVYIICQYDGGVSKKCYFAISLRVQC
jgi:hypothetical protein